MRDTPIAEEGFVGAAIGAAMLGLRPVVEIMTINFSLLALDQIVNHAAKIHGMFGGQVSVPLVIRTPGGGGQQLAATHSQNLEVWYAHVPGMKVVAPVHPGRRQGAARGRDPRRRPGAVPREPRPLQHQGRGARRRPRRARSARPPSPRTGTDITLIGYSRMATVVALEVAARLAAGRDLASRSSTCAACARWTARRSAPRSARPARAVVLEDDWLTYGIGAEIAATIQDGAFDYLDAPVRRVATAEVPLPYAKPLELAALPDAADLSKVIRETLDATRFAR